MILQTVDRFDQTNINVQENSNLIWNIADTIRGLYKPHEYGEVILPFTVIKRFHDTLLPTRDKVLEKNKELEERGFEKKDLFLQKASGYQFYNTSPYTFDTLLADSENIEANLRSYLYSFSENVQDILKNFEIENEITKLASNGKLYAVVQEFNSPKAYMGADKITSTDMGYIFEDLVRRFSESYNEEAGAHFTSRDIIYLMTDLLVAPDYEELVDNVGYKTVYDQTMGTSQMLSAMQERLSTLDKDANIDTFGQEINPQTYAIAKADAMIRGTQAENMQLGNTLSNDKLPNYEFDYAISNPPFGVDWKAEHTIVKEEHDTQGFNGRFGPGLPRRSDGQLLFTLNSLSKLKDDGRMAIIHNGSALFTGNPGGGESEIRRFVIENDYVDAIIQLPNDLFYNTGITTYIWVYDKNKSENRKGKVQLIDASNAYVSRRKNIGDKRVDLDKTTIDLVLQAYNEFTDAEYEEDNQIVESKVFLNEEFGFTRVTIESPERDEEGNIVTLKNGKPKMDTSLRDTEDIPLTEDVEEYFESEVKPFNPDAWMDRKKDKIGYEIPFTRLFYKYTAPEPADEIAERIKKLEEEIVQGFEALSGKDVSVDE